MTSKCNDTSAVRSWMPMSRRDKISISAILADPIVGDLMAADKVDAGELRLLLDKIADILTRRRRFEALVKPYHEHVAEKARPS
jgi:hypothetical protein